MALSRGSIAGCCASANFYNVGYAHGYPRYKSVEDFAYAIIDHGYSRINVVLLNDEQDKEAEYLEAIGFKKTPTTHDEKYGDEPLSCYAASDHDLNVGLAPYREKRAEQVRKQMEARKAAAKAKEEERLKRLKVLEEAGLKRVTVESVRSFLTLGDGRRKGRTKLREWVKEEFNFDLPNHDPYWHNDAEIAKAINYRIVKRALDTHDETND